MSLTVCVLILNNNYHPISRDITPSFTTPASIRGLKLSTNQDAFKRQIFSKYIFAAVTAAARLRCEQVYLLFDFHHLCQPEAGACCSFRRRPRWSGISPLPPADIICFTVTTQQHESDVDTLISCTHGCFGWASLSTLLPAAAAFPSPPPFSCRLHLTFDPGHSHAMIFSPTTPALWAII